jgi:hypothetical protein
VNAAWPQTNLGGFVRTFSIAGNTVYMGGDFTQIVPHQGPAVDRGKTAAIDKDTHLLPWNPNVNQRPEVMVVSGDTAYLGGFFTNMTSLPRFFYGTASATGTGAANP